MTLYTDGLIINPDRNLLDDVVTSQGDAAQAAFEQAWFENPTTALRRISELNRAELGPVTQQAYPAYGIKEVRAEPETPLLSAEEARTRVKDSGLDISIDDAGIREGALGILLERKRAERERQFVLENAPGSTVPVQLLAGFAASAIDPINLASAFIPVVGEARYATALGRATTTAGRFAARARLGAVEGAVGAAVVEPIVLAASAQDQADYGITDSLLNIAFGGILGGGLHGVGGAISDIRRTNVLNSAAAEVDVSPAGQPVVRRSLLEIAIAKGDDDPMLALRESLARSIEADRPLIEARAQQQAAVEVIPQIRAELEQVAAGRLGNVRDLKTEQAGLQQRLDALDDTYRERAKAFQGEGMTRKQAERAARDAIAEERKTLTERQAEVTDALEGNRQSELARAEIARLDKGDIPERFQQRITERTGAIATGFDLRDTARFRAEQAPWQIREAALRSAIAQSLSGRPIDVEPIFDLADPIKRNDALAKLKQAPQMRQDPDAIAASRSADEISKLPDSTDLAVAEQQLADELALSQEMADQVGFDLNAYMKAENELAADADTFAAAYRAAALCQLRTA